MSASGVVSFFHVETSKQKFLWKQHANELLQPRVEADQGSQESTDQPVLPQPQQAKEAPTPTITPHAPLPPTPVPPPPPPPSVPPPPAAKAPEQVTALTPLHRTLINWHRVLFANRNNWLLIGLERIANELIALSRAFLMMGNTTMSRHLCRIAADLVNIQKYQTLGSLDHGAEPSEDPSVVVDDQIGSRSSSNNMHDNVLELLHRAIACEHSLALLRSRMQRKNPPKPVVQSLLQQLNELLETAPFCLELLVLKTELLMQNQEFQQVIMLLSRNRLFSKQNHSKLVLSFAQALDQCGYTNKAITILQTHVQTTANRPVQANNADANAKKKNNGHGSAETLLQQLVRFVDAKAKADQFTKATKWEQALEQQEKCLEAIHDLKLSKADRHVNLLYDHAGVLMKLERFPEAIRDLERALTLNTSNQMILMRLRSARTQQQSYQLRMKLSG